MAALSGFTLEWSQCGDGSSSGKQLQHDIEMSGLGRSAVNSKVESYFHRPQGVNVQEPAGDLLGLYENEPTLEISPNTRRNPQAALARAQFRKYLHASFITAAQEGIDRWTRTG